VKPGRVLVVDDEPLNRRVLRAILRQDGHTLLEASDGAQALALTETEPVDLVLMDVMMPVMDGLAACAAMKAAPRTADVPVIFLSQRDEAADKVRGLEVGASDYVVKPFHSDEVRARVRTHLKLRQLTLSLQGANHQLRERQARLDEDLRAAADIQRALLPRAAPNFGPLRTAWRFVPSQAVGGDMLDLHPLTDRAVSAYVLDVSGHGVPSAMLTVSVQRSLAPAGGLVLAGGRARSPHAVMQELEREYPFERFERFFTLSYLLVDVVTGELRYCSPAHPPPLLLPGAGGPVERLEAGGPLLGMGLAESVEEGVHTLRHGDRLLLYTDGALEAEDAAGVQFGEERLRALLEAGRGQTLEALLDALLSALAAHREGRPFEDDVSLLALEYGWPSRAGGGA
jgi:sigma-B regulation protein RsbU (phosphoserine phosphatase)